MFYQPCVCTPASALLPTQQAACHVDARSESEDSDDGDTDSGVVGGCCVIS